MRLKIFWLFSFLTLTALMLTWCKTNAPELSFEETLKIYSEQKSQVKEILNFMNDTGSQIENKLNAETKYDAWDSIKWTLKLNTDIVNDNKSKDSEAKISLWLSTDADIQEGFLVKSAKIDINTLLKDFKLYFKLLDFSINSNQPEYEAMVTEIVNSFKDKWLTINADEYIDLLKISSEKDFDMVSYLESKEYMNKIFSEKEKTEYNWYPAWKVTFNENEIKNIIKEINAKEQKEEKLLLTWIEEENIANEDFNKIIDDLKFENTEAYFVIRSSDEVDFVLENIDIITSSEKINIAESINKKTFWKDSKIIKITLSDTEKESNAVYINIGLQPSLTAYGININVESKIEEEIQELFRIEWSIKASLSENLLTIDPEFILSSDSITAVVNINFESKKIKNYKFDTPENAQDINELLWSLLWWSEEFDDEDYVYDYDETYISDENEYIESEEIKE